MMLRNCALLAGTLLLAAACDITDPPPPDPDRYLNLAVISGSGQVELPGTVLKERIGVRLTDRVMGEPIVGRELRFKAPTGSGVQITPSVVSTDAAGEASVEIRLGSSVGRHLVEIDFVGNPGVPTALAVEAALQPIIRSVSPATVSNGEILTLHGDNFGIRPETNEVLIDGSRARVLESTATWMQVIVPECVPPHAAHIVIRRGSLVSPTASLQVTGGGGQPLALASGQAKGISDAAGLSCLRLGLQSTDASYLVVIQNAAEEGQAYSPFKLVGLHDKSARNLISAGRAFAPAHASAPESDFAARFDARLRALEAGVVQNGRPLEEISAQRSASIVVPELGDRRDFKVPRADLSLITVTAVAKGLGQNVIIYEDVEAAGQLTEADFAALVRDFDDPIYPTDVAVFGQPSDYDQNKRVTILLSPAVNRMTPAGEKSFVAGFFFGCDLYAAFECTGGNAGEVLYGVVPDPEGRWGLKHERADILQTLPPVLSHELMHLIHFNRRYLVGKDTQAEKVWLQEGLAHMAEDTVAGVFRRRGNLEQARQFERENLRRAARYLAAPGNTSLVGVGGDGVEERGAAFLFFKYLNNRVGGSLLGKMVNPGAPGTANVIANTGLSWRVMLQDWALALYASGAPELSGAGLSNVFTFGGFDVRGAVAGATGAAYPLVPLTPGTLEFSLELELAASSVSYLRVDAPAGEGVNLIMGGAKGGAFTSTARPQIAVLRIR